MMSTTALQQLLKRVNPVLGNALLEAVKDARRRHHETVEFDHLLNQILGREPGDVHVILHYFDISVESVKHQILRMLGAYPRVMGAAPKLSDDLSKAVEAAWTHAKKWGQEQIRTGNLLFGYLAQNMDRDNPVLRALSGINLGELQTSFLTIVADSSENRETKLTEVIDEHSKSAQPGVPAAGSAGDAISRFCQDFTERARNNNFDPVFGRDHEIQMMLDILARRRKNNPIIVGEAGTGKTAIVEGLAIRIAHNDVPRPFRGARLVSLDVGLLQAGAGVKGEFENRLKDLINEVRNSPQMTILFIDEAHNLIGAGGREGSGDAANLLKPALARGELRAIAATTWSEYKKYFEKDPALTRRFLPILIEEPHEEVAVTMIRGLRPHYERDHGVRILDDACVAAVVLGHRYVPGRHLPDSAVDLIDTAAAKIKNITESKPPQIDLLERELADDELTLATLRKEFEEGRKGLEGQIKGKEAACATIKDRLLTLNEQWNKERTLLDEMNAVREDLLKRNETLAKALIKPEELNREEIQQELIDLTQRLDRFSADLKAVQGSAPLLKLEVDRQIIAKIVSEQTGIPVERMEKDDMQAEAAALPHRLEERIRGQRYAINRVSESLTNYYANLNNPSAPIGVFLCLGSSGTGKTELGVALADIVFGGSHHLTKLNMSEYSEQFTTTRLIGSPPGYVGYGEGGILTEAVRQRPYSVVLLDEVEKAHRAVWEIFYDVFDRGALRDGEGRPINFRNTLLLLTSNLGSDIIIEWFEKQRTKIERISLDALQKGPADQASQLTTGLQLPFDLKTYRDLENDLRRSVEKVFTAPLLNRMTILPFLPLAPDIIKSIIVMKLHALSNRVHTQRKVAITFDDQVIAWVQERTDALTMGARLIDHILERRILPLIARRFLALPPDALLPETFRLAVVNNDIVVEDNSELRTESSTP